MPREYTKDPFAKRNFGGKWRYIKIDPYTYSLIERAISEGKAGSAVQAVNKSMCALFGIRYKSDVELKMERELAYILELGDIASGRKTDVVSNEQSTTKDNDKVVNHSLDATEIKEDDLI